jgi:hypothetical protein
VSDERLIVRVTISFFEDLDRQLPPERGPLGQPSRADFQAFELVEIIDGFATGFDQLPELIAGRGDYRLMMSTGMLVRAYTVIAQRASDGAVELISLELDLGQDWS